MKVNFSILLFIICNITWLNAQNNPANDSFASPLKPPFLFSGNFGELRPAHFHSGLDFRTQGRTGLPVFAVKDGYISRIGVSATGYGNALYMNHPDGTTSVYGHLEKFHPDIRKYVMDEQYDRENFQVNLYPPAGKFRFKKGEIIAWSGNSGSSGGPHLHFEIRNTKSERVSNPIFYNFGIKDNSKPKITALYVYPLSGSSNVGEQRNKKRFETVPVTDGYRITNNQAIPLFGKIGFGIQAEDYFNGVGLKCGIYGATISCDGNKVFGFKMDNFSFDQTRYANSQADYEEYVLSKRWIQRLYKQPGNHLDIYTPPGKNGVFDLEDGKSHQFEITVFDAHQNKTTLKFRTISKKSQLPVKKITGKPFLADRQNEFENNKIKVIIPAGALYDHIDFTWKPSPQPAGCYSEIHHVHTKTVPLNSPYSLAIKCSSIPEELRDKALIVSVDPASGRKTAIGGAYSAGWVTASTNVFGSFSVTTDTKPPVISSLSIKGNKVLTNPSKVQFKITDDLSGIKSYRGEIDGNWVLFEYDGKSATLSYTFDKERMVFGKSHLLRLVVTDNRDNRAEYKAIIYK